MQINIPYSVEYDVTETVPLDDVIDSLMAVRSFLTESAEYLGELSPSIKVESFSISVSRISQESPLREVFFVSLFLAFQDELKELVGDGYSTMTGEELSDHMLTLVTFISMALLYYGIGAAKDLAVKQASNGHAKAALEGLAEEIAKQSGTTKQDVLSKVYDRYEKQSKLGLLIKNANKLLRPVKRNPGRMLINKKEVPKIIISELPDQQVVKNANDTRRSRDINGILIRLHAQDKDNANRGWAATIDDHVTERCPVKLLNGVEPQLLWGRDSIMANVTVISQWQNGENRPIEIHVRSIAR